MPKAILNIDTTDRYLKALSIAASVFSQINDTRTIVPESGSASYTLPVPRTLKDFRESVDAVFKAAGLDKVEWENGQ